MGIKEETFYEGGPHVGDLIINILLGFTVICLPLTVGAIVRSLWLRYRITDRRISITGVGRDAIAQTLSIQRLSKSSKFPVVLVLGETLSSPLEMAAV
jgi:hypothetical protein